MAAGLPRLNPYKNVDANFEHGVNFAVAGATALPVQILAEINISSPLTSSALTVQLDWMSSHFNSICHNHTDCMEKLRNSLFMVGEIGGNEINYALVQGQTIDEIKSLVPAIVRAISDAVQSVFDKGAARIVVPGNFPIGCLPIYLTSFQTNNSAAYDELHCLKDLNNISMYQNELLKRAIKELKQENPNATIVYGDYYNSFTWLLRNAQHFGFDVASLLKSCCGTRGDYNFNLIRFCGDLEVPVCPDPSTRISWDGLHLTQDAYNMIARWIITDILPHFHCFR